MSETNAIVFVIDDDVSVRDGLASLFRSVGLRVEVFESGEDFLCYKRPELPSCLVLDGRLPGLSGLTFQEKLLAAKINIPIIFITAYGDIPMSVRAMKAGAFEFLTKPLRDHDVLESVQLALDKDTVTRKKDAELAGLQSRLQALSSRERELLPLIISGRLNKQIAADVGLSEVSIKFHRAGIMRKMQAGSREDLVRIADRLKIAQVEP